jgi:hypothetical protein
MFRIAFAAVLALLPAVATAQIKSPAAAQPVAFSAPAPAWTAEALTALPYPSEGSNPITSGAMGARPCSSLRIASFWHVACLHAVIWGGQRDLAEAIPPHSRDFVAAAVKTAASQITGWQTREAPVLTRMAEHFASLPANTAITYTYYLEVASRAYLSTPSSRIER